jgi:putative transposase
LLYEVFGISRQAYYKRLHRQSKTDKEIKEVVRQVQYYRREQPRLGTYKVYKLIKPFMLNMQIKLGRDKFFDIMRQNRMLVQRKKRFHKTTNSNHRFRKHPNLIKGIVCKRSEQVWVSDITYIKTEQGYLYLSLITDLYSKKIMGHSLSDNQKVESTANALKNAISQRAFKNRSLIHHSDRGFQYCSDEYTGLLKANKIGISMTQSYDPYENAAAERVNGILKDEFEIGEGFINEAHASREINHAIKVYNSKRPHMSCDYATPEFAHRQQKHKFKSYSRLSINKQISTNEKRSKKEKTTLNNINFN